MDVHAFTDDYGFVAPLYGLSPEELRDRDERRSGPVRRWIAADGGRPVAAVELRTRPDDRTFLVFRGGSEGRAALGRAVARSVTGTLYVLVEVDESGAVEAMEGAGFVVDLVEDRFVVPFAAALSRLRRASVPSGMRIESADGVDEARLFTLDNTIRQDVPGTDGWKGDRLWFAEELAEAPPFDPAGYQVAIDRRNGEYVGLCRMWRNPDAPRLGLVGVVRQYRNTTIAAALLASVLAAAAEWGSDGFVTETSRSNRRIHPRLVRLGAERTGSFARMVRV